MHFRQLAHVVARLARNIFCMSYDAFANLFIALHPFDRTECVCELLVNLLSTLYIALHASQHNAGARIYSPKIKVFISCGAYFMALWCLSCFCVSPGSTTWSTWIACCVRMPPSSADSFIANGERTCAFDNR